MFTTFASNRLPLFGVILSFEHTSAALIYYLESRNLGFFLWSVTETGPGESQWGSQESALHSPSPKHCTNRL
ncbi:hypothetical protein EI94DRAFT_1733851 [Lactarius quietus]|nr:hypothetical protein EI94DRAFT_1733851 [Lactarius quietus]